MSSIYDADMDRYKAAFRRATGGEIEVVLRLGRFEVTLDGATTKHDILDLRDMTKRLEDRA